MRNKQVGLLLSMFAGFGEGVREGIARFGATRPGWHFVAIAPKDLDEPGTPVLEPLDGLLGGVASEPRRAAVMRQGLPFVELMHGSQKPIGPAVYSDEHAIGQQAAEHLLHAGFEHLAMLRLGKAPGPADSAHTHSSSDERAAGFTRAVRAAGHEPTILWIDWVNAADVLAAALRDMPTPLGLMGTDDHVGKIALQTAEVAGRRVPDDLAVVGVNDSILVCAFSNPPLSSVRPDWERIGYEGAALLQRLMDGQAAPDGPVLIPPLGVTVRQSSDVLAIDDPDVAAAMRWIRGHAHEPGDVGDLLQALPMPRRSIERKFRAAVGYSPAQAIRRAKIEHVKRLLTHTDWPMPRVAAKSAYRDAKDLATQFKKMTGEPPTTFRARYRTTE